MRQATRNYFLAVLLFLLGLVEVVSGFVLCLVLPGGEGYMGGRGLASEVTFLWSRGTWIDLHTVVGVALVVVVIIHLILHRKWIIRMTKRLGAEETN
ncbi:MAG: DUF4405 domain-containing protein [Chloroflexota bacterium]|nr:DUF4405 domain-containing protein [Chloroflexota bacterium]